MNRNNMIIDTVLSLDALDFTRSNGLLTVVAQHAHTGEVLMVAHANRDALENTLRDRELWLYSRSRSELWRKGATSGNTMRVLELHGDCDGDAVVALVLPSGPACHTGARTCFGARPTLVALADTIAERADSAGCGGYTRRLLDNENLRLKKLGEEAVELGMACMRGDSMGAAEEGADLLYHTLVACHAAGATLNDVAAVLEKRSERASSTEQNAVNEK